MISSDNAAILIMGAVFALVGLISVLLWMRESRSYDYQLSRRLDAREFLTHWPSRSWLQAWRIGGWVALIIGVGVLAAAGIMLWLG